MTEFYIYLDYGSGYVLVNPVDNNLKLSLKRGVLNDFIQRKVLDGDFKLEGSEFDTANTYFIINGNYKAPMRIYQNGISGVGVLKYEGWARVKGLWDYRRSLVTFNSFETDDQYTELSPMLDVSFEGESLQAFGAKGGAFVSQGQNTNANKLHTVTFDGTDFTIGNSASISNLGYPGTTLATGEVTVYDPVNGTLKGYTISGGTWTEVRSKTLNIDYRITAIVSIGSSDVSLLNEVGWEEVYRQSGSTYNLTSGPTSAGERRYPSMVYVNSRRIIVDELSSSISAGTGDNPSIEVGTQVRPSLASIGGNNFALIDAGKAMLQSYSFAGSSFAAIGNSLQISGLRSPKITYFGTNQIMLHCAITGILRSYSFDGTDWTQTGNTASLTGGYTSSLTWSSGNGMIAVSDAFIFQSSVSQSYYQLFNNILFNLGIDGTYSMPTTGNGSTMDINNLIFTDMSDVADNTFDDGKYNYYEYNLEDLLKWYELFQNYWYVDSSNNVKFTQPSLFSSFGTDIDISSLSLVDELNQVLYKDEYSITKEEVLFNNAQSVDSKGNYIIYDRNTLITETTRFPFTTDLDFLVDVFTGVLGNKKQEKSGVLIYYLDSTGPDIVASDTGIISTTDTRNYLLSQSQIYNDYLKDYRYQAQGNITINGASSAIQDTCRSIITYPDVNVSKSMISITEFPDSVANLIWGGGKESLIMDFSQELFSGKITIKNRLHDL